MGKVFGSSHSNAIAIPAGHNVLGSLPQVLPGQARDPPFVDATSGVAHAKSSEFSDTLALQLGY